MIGNSFAGDEIAIAMREILKSKKLEKTALLETDDAETSSPVENVSLADDPNPEDFLINEEEEIQPADEELSNKISDVSSYNPVCDQCGAENCECLEDACPTHNEARDACGCPPKEDVSYLIDNRAKRILQGLGKVAGSLRAKDEDFAADLVAATAMSIKQDYIKEASKKAHVVNSLKKMATDFYANNNELAGDLVTVTINKIKSA